MSVAPDRHVGWPPRPAGELDGLLDAAGTAVGQLADDADLAWMADGDAAAVMGSLTTLIARLDGLRVEVARTVRDREICGLRGVRNLTSWLRADPRLADDAWKICRLAAMTPELPKIAGLLADGTVSLAQAGTACWQISQLPGLPHSPDHIDAPAEPGAPAADNDGDTGQEGEQSAGDAWAGLWRAGNVHAAADELFSTFMPGMDGVQLRQMGAHLREAADTQERADQDYDDYAHRGLRISRSLAGAGEITGRLHAEAAEQVIAAFEELGGKTGPDDKRTKAQRWADALARLTATTPDLLPGPSGPADTTARATDPEDDQPCDADPHTGHDHGGEGHDSPAGHDHGGEGHDSPAGHDHGDEGHDSPGHDLSGERHGGNSRAESTGGRVPAAYRRPRVIVTVPLSTLLGQPLAPGAILGPGTPLTAEAARRLACDAETIRLITAPGNPLNGGRRGDATARLTELIAAAIAQLPPPLGGPSAVLDIGRKSPGWTPRQRDALYAQYGGHCSTPRCTGPIDVIHHIVHWIHGGLTRIINGAPFCSHHHWLVHEGGWRVKRQRDGTITLYPPPPGWRPGTIYRRGKPVAERASPPDTS
jgi:hypothetical protein